MVLIREYGAGVDEYQITLPKGAYEHGEDWRDAANRELKEEAGYGARKLTLLKRMTLSPGYMGHHITVALAEDLYEERLPGDEPEPLEVFPGNCHGWMSCCSRPAARRCRTRPPGACR